jgi:hypothetical protein
VRVKFQTKAEKTKKIAISSRFIAENGNKNIKLLLFRHEMLQHNKKVIPLSTTWIT